MKVFVSLVSGPHSRILVYFVFEKYLLNITRCLINGNIKMRNFLF